jgi:hypothetical protein
VEKSNLGLKKLEDSIRIRTMIEVFHNMQLIPDHVYYSKYSDNAETLDRDYQIWKEIKKK